LRTALARDSLGCMKDKLPTTVRYIHLLGRESTFSSERANKRRWRASVSVTERRRM
jgi:hypothetical protein